LFIPLAILLQVGQNVRLSFNNNCTLFVVKNDAKHHRECALPNVCMTFLRNISLPGLWFGIFDLIAANKQGRQQTYKDTPPDKSLADWVNYLPRI